MSKMLNESTDNSVAIVSCDDLCEYLRIEFDPEYNEFYVGVLSYYYASQKLSVKDRIRHAWHILRTGKPYGDQLIIGKDRMKELHTWLGKTLSKKK